MSCADVEELAPELALGILPGDQRSQVLAHLDGCAACRRLIKELSDAGDALLSLAPEIEPSPGFARRVTKGMRPGAGFGPGLGRSRRLRWVATAAGVAFIVGLAVGLLPGRLGGGGTVPVRTAVFVSGGGESLTGEVYARSSDPSWVFMTVEDGNSSGTYTCMLVLADGRRLPIGSFPMHSGSGSWGRSVDVAVGTIRTVVLLDASGGTAATATLG